MKQIAMLIMVILLAGCKKNTQQPAATPQAQNNSQNSTSSTTLTPTEQCMVAKWYYEKSEVISNDVITNQFTYTTTPSYNTLEFKSAAATVDPTNYPNFKQYVRVQNGAIHDNLCWKINDVGILNFSISGSQVARIDSLNSNRLVFVEYTSLQPLNGTRYYLHK